ncbi:MULTISPECIES: GNAT family N-acetyltransferase [Pseudoalteromonas]|uniref:GNAT family N-acetyltransferase n=1 Tax=Pseudoalteromonas amylolytica TaxID=1859457 RepID=A0A1S1MWG4_9GAMM|nr:MULTISPECIES: GNAT family N-acetyltransferase [Pseudoalteromonas]OHU87778.1 GNAT family N-acetyltransferase [Pseudoalteromonas sp. JW3]OHU91218.1 GNAT family N-acetyltransferase [Pseudoalteromonas amylolytica]
MDILFLADKVELKPLVAKWYFEQWGDIIENASIALFEQQLDEYLNRDCMPLIVVALEGEQMIGVAQLKYREMSIYPDREHWLGGVFVAPKWRGQAVATALVDSVEQVAKSLGIKELFLQTEALEGGLYKRVGWQSLERVTYCGVDVQVMSKRLKP